MACVLDPALGPFQMKGLIAVLWIPIRLAKLHLGRSGVRMYVFHSNDQCVLQLDTSAQRKL